MRFKFFIFAIALLLLAMTPAAFAMMPDMPPEFLAQCEKETPLVQPDIDAFIKMWPLIISAGGELPVEEANALYKKYGLSETRGTLVVVKIANARTIDAIVRTTKDKNMAVKMLLDMNMPQVLIPSDAEIELVTKNKTAIDALPGMTSQ